MRLSPLPVLGFACLATACDRLPDHVPWEATFTVESGRLPDVAGADLLADGKPVSKVGAESSAVIAVARGTSPKADLRRIMNATFAIRKEGACGPVEIPLGQISPGWRELPDKSIASRVSAEGRFPLHLEVKLPPRHELLVDRGASTATLEVGTVSVPRETKRMHLSLAGCPGKVPVKIDGNLAGELEPAAPAHLVTLEPGVCHVFEKVLYGKGKPSRGPELLPASPVVKVSGSPAYLLEHAPEVARVSKYGDAQSTELVRVGCR